MLACNECADAGGFTGEVTPASRSGETGRMTQGRRQGHHQGAFSGLCSILLVLLRSFLRSASQHCPLMDGRQDVRQEVLTSLGRGLPLRASSASQPSRAAPRPGGRVREQTGALRPLEVMRRLQNVSLSPPRDRPLWQRLKSRGRDAKLRRCLYNWAQYAGRRPARVQSHSVIVSVSLCLSHTFVLNSENLSDSM